MLKTKLNFSTNVSKPSVNNKVNTHNSINLKRTLSHFTICLMLLSVLDLHYKIGQINHLPIKTMNQLSQA